MSTASSPTWSALSRELSDSATRVAPSIVQVHGRSRPASGIVWAPERVLSTSHSVEWQDGVRVRAGDGTVLPADVVGHDAASDLVLLRVAGLAAQPIARAEREASIGDLVLLTGRSWSGRQHARVLAITGISGPVPTRYGSRLDHIMALPVAPFAGLSGAAVLDASGSLAGIATAGLARGRALALPVQAISPIAEAIERHGGIKRGYVGVVTQPVRVPARQRGEAPADRGLLVLDITPDSPADTGGIFVGDVIVGADDARLSSPEDLLAMLGPDRVGKPLALAIIRGGTRSTMTVTVAERVPRG
jgi:serine protease DegQ